MFPQRIKQYTERAEGYKADIETVKANTPREKEWLPMTVNGTTYTKRADAGKAIIEACKGMKSPNPIPLGKYRGFVMELSFDTFSNAYQITLKGKLTYTVALGSDIHGNITRLDNMLASLKERLTTCTE